MIYRYEGTARYYFLVTRVLLTAIFALGVVAAASDPSWKGALGTVILVFLALVCLKESWVYLRSLLQPVILQIEGDQIYIRGLGRIPLRYIRRFSFHFLDTAIYPNGLRVAVSRSTLSVDAEIGGRLRTKTFRILPDNSLRMTCMNMAKHEVLSALAAHFPGIKKVRKEKTPGVANVFLDFENYKPH